MKESGRARELIEQLQLQPHPERGYYAETYRAPLQVHGLPLAVHGLPERGPRSASTAVYYLVTAAQPSSRLHRLRSDELFHLYEGGPLEVLLLVAGQPPIVRRLGLDLAAGERPQWVIPAGTWFGTELVTGASHCLIGCTVAPGFEFADFELAEGEQLCEQFPAASERIRRMLG
jgi:predicted cupin superfamily sugar epimerase